MTDAQIEMSFEQLHTFTARPQRRLTRAQWWFQRMRQIVDRAIDWQPAPAPRPEQIWFPVTTSRHHSHAAIDGASRSTPLDERQICE